MSGDEAMRQWRETEAAFEFTVGQWVMLEASNGWKLRGKVMDRRETPEGVQYTMSERPDAPHVDLFNRWYDAYHEAVFRAEITGRRYRVWFEPNNHWWNITELVEKHQ